MERWSQKSQWLKPHTSKARLNKDTGRDRAREELTMLAAVSSEARDDPAALARVRARPNRKSA